LRLAGSGKRPPAVLRQAKAPATTTDVMACVAVLLADGWKRVRIDSGYDRQLHGALSCDERLTTRRHYLATQFAGYSGKIALVQNYWCWQNWFWFYLLKTAKTDAMI
jgi:hypothetical protein